MKKMEVKQRLHRSLMLKKVLNIMQLKALSLLMVLLTISLSSYSQTTMDLEFENETLKTIFSKIEQNSEFSFLYKDELIKNTSRKSGNFKNLSVNNILDKVLENEGLSYSIKGKLIMIISEEDKRRMDEEEGKIITGQVTNNLNEPIPGVNVFIKGSLEGTITDLNGNYAISNVPEGSILVFSFVGMLSKEVLVNNQANINIQLEEDVIGLEDVVVIGYGTKMKKNLIGAIDQINSSIIEGRPVENTMQALQGASANLIIQQRSMNPNDNTMNINIRGVSTMNNNDPLVVIDGVITEMASLNNLNPADIDNISILKDAGSAAIYGSRSSNGVILVTTKKGQKNSKPVIRISSMVGLQQPNVLFSPVKGYENAILRNQALINGGSSPVYTPERIRDLQRNGDGEWFLDGIIQNALQQTYNASVAGGTENSTYMISAGYYNQESNFVGGYGAERYNFRTNLTSEYGRVKVSGLMSYNRRLDKVPEADPGILMVDATRIPAYYDYKLKAENGNYLINDVLSQFNPLGKLEAGGYQEKDYDNFLINLSAEVEIIKGLTAKGIVGFDLSANHRFIRRKQVPFYSSETATVPSQIANADRNTEDFNEKKYVLNTQFLLEYNRTFNNAHNFNGLIGVSNESYTRQGNEIKLKYTDIDLGIPETNTEIDPSSYTSNQETQQSSINSLFGRLGYSYKNKYYGEFSFRYDGSSKFAKEYRWGFFPSATAGWRLSEENFMTFYREKVGSLKIRSSYGVLGNQNIDDYSYLTTYTVYSNTYGFNNESVAGAGFDFVNSELQWEESSNFNVGLDLTFLKDKLYASLDYFHKTTSRILLKPVVPTVFGGTVSRENAGKMLNQGWEATIGYRAVTGDFKHNVMLNVSDNINEVIDFGGNEQIDPSDQMLKLIREGEPLGSYFGYQTDGLFQNYDEIANSALPIGATVEPGDVKYKDLDNNGVIDDNDRTILGNAFPRYTFGMTYELRWKNFDFSMLVQGVGKRDMFLRGELVEPFHSNYSYVMYTHQLDYWTPLNTDAKWPRLSSPGSASNTNNYGKGSDLYIFNASYVRLKNIQLGYTIPKDLTTRWGVQKLRVSVHAQNLFTLSNISFIDPESTEFGNNMGGTGGTGANSGRNYPTLKYYGFSVDIQL